MINNQSYFNYVSTDNNAKVISCSSHALQCPPSNILLKQTRSFWFSKENTPQFVTIDLQTQIRHPRDNHYNYWGIYNRYSSEFNPKKIELLFSFNNIKFKSFGLFDIKNKAGVQIFPIQNNNNPLKHHLSFFKIVIKEAYGRNTQCYINKLFLFDLLNASINKIEEEIKTKILNEKDNHKQKAFDEDTRFENVFKTQEITNLNILSEKHCEELKKQKAKQKEEEKAINSKVEDSFFSTKDRKDPIIKEQINKISSIIKKNHNAINDSYCTKWSSNEEDNKCSIFKDECLNQSKLYSRFNKAKPDNTCDYDKEKLNNRLDDLGAFLMQMKLNQSPFTLKNRIERVEKKLDNIECDLYGKRSSYSNNNCYKNTNINQINNTRMAFPTSFQNTNSSTNIFKINRKDNDNDFIYTLYDIVLKKDCEIIREKAFANIID